MYPGAKNGIFLAMVCVDKLLNGIFHGGIGGLVGHWWVICRFAGKNKSLHASSKRIKI